MARNPSDKTKTRLLAVILHPRDAKERYDPGEGQEIGIVGVTDRLHLERPEGVP